MQKYDFTIRQLLELFDQVRRCTDINAIAHQGEYSAHGIIESVYVEWSEPMFSLTISGKECDDIFPRYMYCNESDIALVGDTVSIALTFSDEPPFSLTFTNADIAKWIRENLKLA